MKVRDVNFTIEKINKEKYNEKEENKVYVSTKHNDSIIYGMTNYIDYPKEAEQDLAKRAWIIEIQARMRRELLPTTSKKINLTLLSEKTKAVVRNELLRAGYSEEQIVKLM